MMNVEPSPFLRKHKKQWIALITILSEIYDYATLLATDVQGLCYEKNNTEQLLKDSPWKERGVVIRVYHQGQVAEYSFNRVPQKGTLDLIADIRESLRFIPSSEYKGIQHQIPQEEELSQVFQGEQESDGLLSTPDKVFQELTRIHRELLQREERIKNLRLRFEAVQVHKLYLSPARDLEQNYAWSDAMLIPIFETKGGSGYIYVNNSGLGGIEILHKGFNLEETLKKMEALYAPEKLKPGTYQVILAPDVSGTIAHESFGHGVEEDMFVKNRALAQDFLNQKIGSNKVTIRDGAASAENVASYFFDDEGILARDTIIMEKGVFQSGLRDALSAEILGKEPTGNGRRESFKNKVYSRMTNTFIQGGEETLEEMIQSIDHGYLVDNMLSGMEDPKNWGIQLVCQLGYEIREGRLTGKCVSPVYLTGTVPEVLEEVTMVSPKVELFGAGMCGKGYKEWAKVSSGGPYIKTKVRLG